MFQAIDNIYILQTKCYIWGLYESNYRYKSHCNRLFICMCIVCTSFYYFEGATECSIELVKEMYESESISYYFCFNFDSYFIDLCL